MYKRLKEHAVHVAESAVHVVSSEPCGRCGTVIQMSTLQLTVCRVCTRRVCGNCLSKVTVQDAMIDTRYTGNKSTSSAMVCTVACYDKCVEANVAVFRNALTETHDANADSLLQATSSDVVKECYARPVGAVAPTGAAAVIKRLAPLAMEVLKLTGYGTAVAYAYSILEGGGLAAVLLSPKTRLFCERIMPVLRRHFFHEEDAAKNGGIKGTLKASKKMTAEASELALRLYYFGCSTSIDRLIGEDEHNEPKTTTDDDEELEKAMALAGGECVGIAQWLYAARELRCPHDGPDWASWYTGRLAARMGWSLVACVGASRAESERCVVPRHPPTLFPAWCLAVRTSTKEAVLNIRGSVTQADWVINSDLEQEPLNGGYAHGGMLRSALAILDDCGCRALIDKFEGYDLTIVGHSLGAGVATILTSLLLDNRRKVRCVAYATPACVSPELSDSLEPHVLSVVHRDDLVPRLSDANCAVLAKELVEDDLNYKRRLAYDKAAVADHLKTLGKVHAMMHEDTPIEEEKLLRQVQSQDEGEDEGKDSSAGETEEKKVPPPLPPRPQPGKNSMAPRLVVPGRILYLHCRDASYTPILGNHKTLASHLNHIIVSSRAVEDHFVEAHLNALREARWRRGDVPKQVAPPTFQNPATLVNGKPQFHSCSCCGSDTTWTSIAPGSDSARAIDTFHCRACGQVVCSFCAPAGDVVAGDGIGKTLKLRDKRLSLPSLGHFTPVRVCYTCAFTAYDL